MSIKRYQSSSLEDAIKLLDNTIASISVVAKEMLSTDNGNMYVVDFIAIGALKRSLENSNVFVGVVANNQMATARSLTRIQLDTLFRFRALWLVESPTELAIKILKNERFSQIQDNSGNKMRDRYLVENLNIEYPWVLEVYENLCGLVHFSNAHISDAITSFEDGKVAFNISESNAIYPEISWIEIVDCFNTLLAIFLHYVHGWTGTKSNGSGK